MSHDDREAATHRSQISARYGEVINVWADRTNEYIGRRDEQITELKTPRPAHPQGRRR